MSLMAEMFAEARKLSRLIDNGVDAMRESSTVLADAEWEYREAVRDAWAEAPAYDRQEWTAARREAWVKAETAGLRRARDVAAGKNRAAIEAVRARQAQLSMLQTFAKADQEELALAHYGPEDAA